MSERISYDHIVDVAPHQTPTEGDKENPYIIHDMFDKIVRAPLKKICDLDKSNPNTYESLSTKLIDHFRTLSDANSQMLILGALCQRVAKISQEFGAQLPCKPKDVIVKGSVNGHVENSSLGKMIIEKSQEIDTELAMSCASQLEIQYLQVSLFMNK